MIAIDTETWRIAPGRLAPRMVCVSYADHDKSGVLAREQGLGYMLRRLDTDERFVGANISYDFAVIAAATYPRERLHYLRRIFAAYDEGRVHDVQVREQLHNIALGRFKFDPDTGRPPRYSLAALVERHFGEQVDGKGPDAWRTRYHELDGLPITEWPTEAVEYSRLDAVYTLRVYGAQADRGDPSPDEAAQTRAAWALHLMGCWGLRTDPVKVAALRKEHETEIDRLRASLASAGLLRPTGSKNMAAIKARVAAALGDEAPKTKTGQVATDRETLESTGDGDLEALARLVHAEKFLATYVCALEEGRDVPINPRWRVLVETGRTSCARPNLQNLPKKGGVRAAFVPRPGHVFALCDYSIAELRALAQILLWEFGESAMARAFQAGRELHLEVAAEILGVDYEEAMRLHADGVEEVKDARQLAKVANFGLAGGMGADALSDWAWSSYKVRIPPERAQTLKQAWLRRFPEMRQYFARVAEAVEYGGGAARITQAVSGRVRGGCRYTQACNSPFQGIVADFSKAALYRVTKECFTEPESPLWTCRPVIFVHDEIGIECPSDRAPEAAERLAEIMIEEGERACPDIPILAEPVLTMSLSTDAEPVRDGAGRLGVWRPEP